MNYYDILGISRSASTEEIKAAYRNMVKAFHPDYYSGNSDFADKKTKELNEAYEVLKDPDRRADYDESLLEDDYVTEEQIRAEKEAEEARARAEEARRREEEARTRAEEAEKRAKEEQIRRAEAEQRLSSLRDESIYAKPQNTRQSFMYNILGCVVGLFLYSFMMIVVEDLEAYLEFNSSLGYLIYSVFSYPNDTYIVRAIFEAGAGVFACEKVLMFFMRKIPATQNRWAGRVTAICIIIGLVLGILMEMGGSGYTLGIVFNSVDS